MIPRPPEAVAWEHAEADWGCKRPWSCQCGACCIVRRDLPGTAASIENTARRRGLPRLVNVTPVRPV